MNHIKNTEAAIEFWSTVPAESVNLSEFRADLCTDDPPSCDSPACFGGWLPYSAYFAALSVIANEAGYPDFSGALMSTAEVSLALFGHSYMFSSRGNDECGTDHEVITARLRAHLAYLISANDK